MDDSEEQENSFPGFVPPTSNYYKTPNIWIDICAEINHLGELKVVQYVLRHTWGYQEYGIKKAITTDEFMHGRKREDGSRIDKGTGLSNHSVIDGLRKAIKDGYLECEIDESDKARVIKYYALKMQSPNADVKNVHSQNSYEESAQLAMKKVHTAVKNVHSDCEESAQRSEKDTKEKHLKKDTGRKKENSARVQPPTQTPALSSPSSKKNVAFEVLFTQQEEAIVAAWEVLSECAAPRTEKLKAAAKELVRCGATKEDLIAVRDYCLRTNGKWYAEHGMDLTTIVSNWSKWKSTKSIPNQQRSSTAGTATTPTSGMTQEEAVQLASDILEQTKQHGYTKIRAKAYEKDGTWLVRVVWETGFPLVPMASREQWEQTLKANLKMDQEDLLLKGAK